MRRLAGAVRRRTRRKQHRPLSNGKNESLRWSRSNESRAVSRPSPRLRQLSIGAGRARRCARRDRGRSPVLGRKRFILSALSVYLGCFIGCAAAALVLWIVRLSSSAGEGESSWRERLAAARRRYCPRGGPAPAFHERRRPYPGGRSARLGPAIGAERCPWRCPAGRQNRMNKGIPARGAPTWRPSVPPHPPANPHG
jgi:hypothetical protein